MKPIIRPKLLLAAALAAFTLAAAPSRALTAGDLDDLNYWGSGSNRAALVIDWNDGNGVEQFVWGFQWDGSLTVADMLLAVASSPTSRLFARIDSDASFGLALFGLGYQTGAAPFGVTGAQDPDGDPVTPVFTAGIDDMDVLAGTTDAPAGSASAAPVNAADHYREAWFTPDRFWGLYLSGTVAYSTTAVPSYSYPASWAEAGAGVSGVTLTDEGWYALTYSDPFWTGVPPGATATVAVPEPGSAALLLVCGAGWLAIRRRAGTGSR
jgi:hypothetical protein